MIEIESPQLPTGMNNINVRSSRDSRRTYSYRSERGSYSHIWELLGYLPREKAVVDRLVAAFIEQLNQLYDGLHEETFMIRYEAFWNRKWSDDDCSVIDLRWLSLLFIVLAFGELLVCPVNASPDIRELSEESSLQFYWASRTAITLAMTFYGESTDAVRCGILVTRYLVYLGRKTEAWLASGFSIRYAQAQGMHIDGESWGLPPKVLETRRRLWCSAHSLEKVISLALGRPSTTSDKNSMEMRIRNVWIDDMADDEAQVAVECPESDPTPSMFYVYQQKLSRILGVIQEECFLLTPLTTSYPSYAKVLNLDEILLAWAGSLPEYFQIENPVTTMDNSRPYLYWQRTYLHFAYHFARVTLHKTYVLLDSRAHRFEYSREVCINSASADLKLKLSISNLTMADRLKAGVTMHRLFGSGLVLGVLVVRDPLSTRTSAILEDLVAYCEKQNSDAWANDFVLSEVRVIELCISSARKSRQESGIWDERAQVADFVDEDANSTQPIPSGHGQTLYKSPTTLENTAPGLAAGTENEPIDTDGWLESLFGPNRNFPEPGDYQSWERLVDFLAPV
jgi:Fungal specific transcription factor domain